MGKRYINVVEPTIFSSERTRVTGPFRWLSAMLRARLHGWLYPHAQVMTVRSNVLVLLGEKPIWDGRDEVGPEISLGPYR